MRVAALLLALCYAHSPIFGPSEDSRERVSADAIRAWVGDHQRELLDNYFWLHANPEVSFEEEKTAEYLASIWKKAGFVVTENVGGFGIVGVLKNGEGPTVMLRTDLDALPVKEDTGLHMLRKKRSSRKAARNRESCMRVLMIFT